MQSVKTVTNQLREECRQARESNSMIPVPYDWLVVASAMMTVHSFRLAGSVHSGAKIDDSQTLAIAFNILIDSYDEIIGKQEEAH